MEAFFSLVAERGIMIEIEELMKLSNHFYILVDKKNYKDFLSYCVENGLTWKSGDKISPEKDVFRCWDRMWIIKGKYIGSLKGSVPSMKANAMDWFDFDDIRNERAIIHKR